MTDTSTPPGSDPILQHLFPGAVPESQIVSEAERRGWLRTSHEVACITVCREPGCRSIERPIRGAFPTIFDFYSLGGIPTIGATSVEQAWLESGTRGVAYFAFTHVALPPSAKEAQGALQGCQGLEFLLHDIATRRIDDRTDPYDWEYTLVRRAFLAADAPANVRWNIASLAKFMARAAGDIARGKLEGTRHSDAELSVVSGVHVTCGEVGYVWMPPQFEGTRVRGRDVLPANQSDVHESTCGLAPSSIAW